MLDSQIVAAIIAAYPERLAAAYDRYAAPLYAFCHSLLIDQAHAADVVQDTFIIASARLDGSGSRSAQVMAVCRGPQSVSSPAAAPARRCLRAGEVSDDTIDFGIDLEHAQLTEVVGAAMAALPLARLEVIELSLRQDFDGDDLGSTLGVSPNQAQVLATQARGQFEESVAALLVARSGAAVLRRAGRDARQSGREADRRRVPADRPACSALPHLLKAHAPRSAPPSLLSVLPATEIARGLRRQVLSVVASDAPDVVAYRADVVRGAEPFDEASGFPVRMDRPRRERRIPRPCWPSWQGRVRRALRGRARVRPPSPHRQPQLTAAPVGGQSASPQAQAASSSASGPGAAFLDLVLRGR